MNSQRNPKRNNYGITEWAGAFGDLGTLIPFVVGYISILHMDPVGILAGFGIMLIASGIYYRTPVPVQPMKAIGSAAIAQAATSSMVLGAGLFTGLFWIILGFSGLLGRVSRIITKPVSRGITLGLGLLFITQGTQSMITDVPVSIIAVIIAFLLLPNRKVPAMFAILLFGLIAALIRDPGVLDALATIHPTFRLPEFALSQVSWTDAVAGALILGIPQIPLTLGNAVIAVTAENNRLFPDHPVNEQRIAISQGLMNLIAVPFGGVPMCHGAGGLAGHVRFGARTGGSLVILGGILLLLGLFFGSSAVTLFEIFPASVLGVILFFAGLELAISARDVGSDKRDFYILIVTAGLSLFNVGVGFLAGLLLQEATKHKIVKL